MAEVHERRDRDRDTGNAEYDLSLIPTWSILLAAIFFVGLQYLFHFKMPHRHGELLAMRIAMGFFWGSALASYALLAGYVSRDVKRRNMSAPLWMLMVILMPAGIGAIVYFLVRQPVVSRCPHCSTELQAGFNFCPQCRFQTAPVCGQCYRSVQITDIYCSNCGHDLAADGSPRRLRAYHDE